MKILLVLGRQEMEFRKLMLVGISLIGLFILLSCNRVDADCNLPNFQCRNGSSISGCFQCDHETDCSDGSDEIGCAQVDYSMALLWSSKDSTSGLGTLGLLYGDPDVFLQQMQVPEPFNTSYYRTVFRPFDFSWSFDSLEVDYDQLNVICSDQAYKGFDVGHYFIGGKRGDFHHLSVPPVSSQVTGLSFDWVSKLVYISDAGYQRIAVYDASIEVPIWWRPVIDKNLTSPQDIVVYPNQSYLFWINSDINPKIERFDLVNEIRKVLVSNDNMFTPTKLAIDFKLDRLYWLDSSMATIGSCNLDGSNVSLWQLDLFSTISAFTFYRQYLFLGDRTRSLIHAFNASGNQVLSNFQLFSTQQGIIDFATYDPSKQISIQSPCTASKGGCSHFCIKINATAKKCQCAMGFLLDSDGRSCVTHKFLLVTDTWQKQLFQVDIATGEVRAVSAVDSFLPTAADYDYVSKIVYWFDRSNNGTIIRQTSLTNGATRIFVNSVAAEITSMAVDTVGRNLYYTQYFAGTIAVISLSTRDSRTILAEPGSRPRVLVLDIDSRSLYWSDCATRSIEKAQMSDPTSHQSVVKQLDFCVSALAIDVLNGVIYWGDQGGNIESSKLDGSARRLIYTDSSANYTGMAADDNYLYIADYSIRKLQKLDRTTNKIGSLTGNFFADPYALILYDSSGPNENIPVSASTGPNENIPVSASTGSNKTIPASASTGPNKTIPASTSTGPNKTIPASTSTDSVSTATTIIVALCILGSVFFTAVAVFIGIVVTKCIKRRKSGVMSDGYDNVIPQYAAPRSNGESQHEMYTELDDGYDTINSQYAPQSNNEGQDEMYTELDDMPNLNNYDLEIDNMGQYDDLNETIESNRRSDIDNDYI